MDFTTLQTEFFARGFDYLNDAGAGLARAKRWINQSYLELSSRASWPFLYADAAGSSPLTITDLRATLAVIDTTNQQTLLPVDRRYVTQLDPNFTAGTPVYYYLDSSTQLKVWPVQVVTLNVRYLKIPAQLSAGGDVAAVPDEWCDIIVDGAVVKAQKDSDLYGNLVQSYEQSVGRMIAALLPRTFDGPDYIQATEKNY